MIVLMSFSLYLIIMGMILIILFLLHTFNYLQLALMQLRINNHLTLLDIKSHISGLSSGSRSSMSEVCKLLKILMVMPCTNAVSERSASALRRVKTYLRTTMSQPRLNHLIILHIHKESTDKLSLEGCLNEFVFVSGSEQRSSLFGHF